LGGHYYYYRSRLRFILKHYTSSQIVDGFVPAEIARISCAPFEELRASSLSTIEGMTLWPFMAWQRRPLPSDAEYGAVLAALRTLQNGIVTVGEYDDRPSLASTSDLQRPETAFGQVHARAGGQLTVEKFKSRPAVSQAHRPESKSPGPPVLAFDRPKSHAPSATPEGEARQFLGSTPYSLLRRELEVLSKSGQVTPKPFRSEIPVLGPLIVAFRDFVNNLATRWYVQGLLDQQVAFNASVSQMLSQVYSQVYQLPEHHSGFLAEQVADLHWQLLTLKSQVARLEGELDERSRNASH
jgi:hypothetical protein